jgi:Cof subfamily protein (haloacid dehalogenase superfamily)
MSKGKQKVLAVDLDGTLFFPKYRRRLISPKNLKFLRDFIQAGNKVILVTSRNRTFAEKTMAKIGHEVDCVCINGAIVVNHGEVLKDYTFADDEARKIFDEVSAKFTPMAWFLDNRKYQNLLYNNEKSKIIKTFFKYYYKAQGIYQEQFLADNEVFLEQLEVGGVYRFLMFFGLGRKKIEIAKEVSKYIRQAHPDFECSWINTIVELAPHDSTKANGLNLIIEKNDINPDDVYVVGDSGNDISMFLSFKNSYCMEHAHESVKKFAKNTIKRVYHLRKVLL